jgi:hypothetical protein
VKPAAPRIDSRLLAALARLDEPGRPIADVHRALGDVADHLRLPRPSYQRTRLLVHEIRAGKTPNEVAEVLLDIAFRAKPPEALAEVLSRSA